MVRNNKGGKNGKKVARKHFSSAEQNRELRLKKDPDEEYAVVTKLFGQGMCEVMCNDSNTRLCIIRNKFKGRSKRDNNIVMGTWVMVGIRSWELLKEGTKQKCDLLEVYNEIEKSKLKDINDIQLSSLVPESRFGNQGDNSDEIEFEFSNKSDIDFDNDNNEETNELNIIIDESNEISIDDI